MTKHEHCPICFSNTSQELINQPHFPYFTTPVSETDKLTILEKYAEDDLLFPLDVHTCSTCCHCYLKLIPDQNTIDFLYSNYYHYPSPLKGRFKPERDDHFLKFFEEQIAPLCEENNLTSVLEVGCYDGYILYHLQKNGYVVTGYDPSKGALIGQEYGVNIIREFFDSEKLLNQNRTFDVVISRHFIEHVISPRDWINQLKQVLNPNGFIVVETPNISFHLKQGLVEVFSLQHLQAFSSYSLNYTLEKAGFLTKTLEETPNNLIVLATQGKSSNQKKMSTWTSTVQQFDQKLEVNRNYIQEIILDYFNKKRTICMWGAGGFGMAALTLYNVHEEHINFIVDSDPRKWELHYIDNSIPIISPEQGKKLKPDLIIITSMYSKNIIKLIHDMEFNVSILKIFPEVSHEINIY
jgi:SAM-dependent methyltransferase